MTRRLLDSRVAAHWEGYLASSALATATATVAFMRAQARDGVVSRERRDRLIAAGLRWLTAHQNADGGWGDTTISLSNVSTTLLCWSALSLGRHLQPDLPQALGRAEAWLAQAGGAPGLGPEALRRVILDRYGSDRTFSVPILTVLAIAGKLGDGDRAWRLVPQLPFELAALPQAAFRWMRLPVVSYALPALVAMGQVRHHRAPVRNPLTSGLRARLRGRTLAVARRMQPASGGYLEAVPLTAFVVMSLTEADAGSHPIVADGLRFLSDSARDDGSWPIDSNLATWVSTLSVDALAAGDGIPDPMRRDLLHWLLEQQASERHPFTQAQPGGWGWTPLSGSVPDADDTAGAVVALWHLGGRAQRDAAIRGIEWLLDLQNRDGGLPTFCRGWGALPFDRSAADLTAHALEAWSRWFDVVPPALQHRLTRAEARALAYLARVQRSEGSWAPLWFGNEHAADDVNLTYGTARVVTALACGRLRGAPVAQALRARGLRWLQDAQNADGGWGGSANTPSSLEETGLALAALSDPLGIAAGEAHDRSLAAGIRWMIAATVRGEQTPPAPIGFYFARLWYHEALYPLIFGLKGLLRARARVRRAPAVQRPTADVLTSRGEHTHGSTSEPS